MLVISKQHLSVADDWFYTANANLSAINQQLDGKMVTILQLFPVENVIHFANFISFQKIFEPTISSAS